MTVFVTFPKHMKHVNMSSKLAPWVSETALLGSPVGSPPLFELTGELLASMSYKPESSVILSEFRDLLIEICKLNK